MKVQNPTKGEVIALELEAGRRQRRIALVFAYWPAGNSQEDKEWFSELEATLTNIQATHDVLLMGDMNARRKEWGDHEQNRRGMLLKSLASNRGLQRLEPENKMKWTSKKRTEGRSDGQCVTMH